MQFPDGWEIVDERANTSSLPVTARSASPARTVGLFAAVCQVDGCSCFEQVADYLSLGPIDKRCVESNRSGRIDSESCLTTVNKRLTTIHKATTGVDSDCDQASVEWRTGQGQRHKKRIPRGHEPTGHGKPNNPDLREADPVRLRDAAGGLTFGFNCGLPVVNKERRNGPVEYSTIVMQACSRIEASAQQDPYRQFHVLPPRAAS